MYVFICIYMLHMCVLFSLEGEDKISHYCIIVLGVSTLGTSVLLWWLYKYFSGKDKYDVEGTFVFVFVHCKLYVCRPKQFEVISMYVYSTSTYIHTYKVMW